MRDKMRRWGLDEAAQDKVVERLTKERYIDEERYARAFVKDKIRYNKWGRRKVEQALWMKHISDDIQQQVLDEIDEKPETGALCPEPRLRLRHHPPVSGRKQRRFRRGS